MPQGGDDPAKRMARPLRLADRAAAERQQLRARLGDDDGFQAGLENPAYGISIVPLC